MTRRDLPRARRYPTPVVVPPARPPGPLADEHRPAIPYPAVRAAWNAHMGDQHRGRVGLACRTCRRYGLAAAITRAAGRVSRGQPPPPATDPHP